MPDPGSSNTQTIKNRLKEETRKAIIEAGISAFAKLGYHGMKIAAVAREAGVANGTFYLHFKDKEALYREIVEIAGAKLASGIFAAHNFHGGKGGADRAEIEAVIEFTENHGRLMRIALDSSAPSGGGQDDLLAPLIELRVRELEAGTKAGHINPVIHPEIGARAEMGMALSVIQWWINHRNRASKEQVVDTLCHIRRAWAVTDSNVEDIDALLSQWDSRL